MVGRPVACWQDFGQVSTAGKRKPLREGLFLLGKRTTLAGELAVAGKLLGDGRTYEPAPHEIMRLQVALQNTTQGSRYTECNRIVKVCLLHFSSIICPIVTSQRDTRNPAT